MEWFHSLFLSSLSSPLIIIHLAKIRSIGPFARVRYFTRCWAPLCLMCMLCCVCAHLEHWIWCAVLFGVRVCIWWVCVCVSRVCGYLSIICLKIIPLLCVCVCVCAEEISFLSLIVNAIHWASYSIDCSIYFAIHPSSFISFLYHICLFFPHLISFPSLLLLLLLLLLRLFICSAEVIHSFSMMNEAEEEGEASQIDRRTSQQANK